MGDVRGFHLFLIRYVEERYVPKNSLAQIFLDTEVEVRLTDRQSNAGYDFWTFDDASYDLLQDGVPMGKS